MHEGQLDKVGDDYIGHPLRVMHAVAGRAAEAGVDVEYTQMAAILHDVVEDTPVTLADLTTMGYPADVVAAVDALSRRDSQPEEDYDDYLARVAADPIAVVVKYADMADNSDPTRLARLDPARAEQLAHRYARRRRFLDDLVARRSSPS
jgi:(p)ppGpp synthase/HD superfamily hydrolase